MGLPCRCPRRRGWGDDVSWGLRQAHQPIREHSQHLTGPSWALGVQVCPQKDPPQAGREHTGSCHSRGCALSQRKDRWWPGEPVEEAGAPTSGTPWSQALGGTATLGMSPQDTPQAGAHSHLWLGHWALLPGWVPLCGWCTILSVGALTSPSGGASPDRGRAHTAPQHYGREHHAWQCPRSSLAPVGLGPVCPPPAEDMLTPCKESHALVWLSVARAFLDHICSPDRACWVGPRSCRNLSVCPTAEQSGHSLPSRASQCSLSAVFTELAVAEQVHWSPGLLLGP